MRSTAPRLTRLAFILLTTTGLLTTALASQMKGPAPLDVRGQALHPAAQSRAEGDEAMDGAVAAAVIGAVSTGFGERRVEVKLDRVAVQPASLRDRNVSGEGRIRIGEDEAGDESRWIRFRFHALYDTRSASVSSPALVLGEHSRATAVALDSTIARALGARVDAALGDEFSHQPAQMVIDQVTTTPIGSRYLRVEALGTADFADEGSAGAQVHALYDRRTGQWLRLAYELGTTANWAPDAAVALRQG